MRKQLRNLWKAAQPALAGPRYATAWFLRRLLRRTTFIAITGSNGKTTATECLGAILDQQAPTQWTQLNRNSMAGFTETIAFCNPIRTRYAVFEVAAGAPNAIRQATRLIRPDVAVVLTVFLEHRSYFGTIEAVAEEKARLLTGLQPGGVAVINADDERVRNMPVPAGCRTILFGASMDSDIRCEDVESRYPELLSFTVIARGRRQLIRTRLLGAHCTTPLLAAIAVADHLGVPLDRIARAIEEFQPYPARMQVVNLPSGATVIRDEYKGSWHSVDVAFRELDIASARRKFIVFGDLADSNRSWRERLGKAGRRAAEIADYVIFVGPKAHHGVNGARKAGMPEDHALAFEEFKGAADFLAPLLEPDDLVLMKASRDNHLTRFFYALIGEVSCTRLTCDKRMVCDDCHEFNNPRLVRYANDKLTVRLT